MAAIAAFSDSRRDRDVGDARRRPRRRRRAGPRARRRRRVTSPSQRARAAARPRGDQRDARAGQLARRSSTRATGTAKIAPIDARTALGPNGSARVGARARRDAAPKASALRSTVPTLPGSPHAPQRHAQRPGRRRPALLVDAERARARAQRRDAVEQLGLARRRRPAAQHVDRRPAGAARRPPAGPRPRPRSARSRRRCEPADLLELVVVGAGDHRSGRGTKRAPS